MTSEPKNTHGGPRTGAGAKPRGDQVKRMVSVRLSAEIVLYLATVENKTEAIEQAVMKTKAFREFKKKLDNIS